MLGLAIEKLTERKAIKQSLVLPFRFLTAQEVILASKIERKNDIIKGLNKAIELSLDNVPTFKGKTLVVLDDSGSMEGKQKNGINPIQLGALFAAVLFKANDADLMRFSDNASYVNANVGDTISTIADNLSKNACFGGTNFHSIFEKATKCYDRIIILSDMQGWVGNYPPTQEVNKYKNKYNANPFIYSFDLAGYGSLQFPEANTFALAGFSDKVFDLMSMLETDKNAMIEVINAIEL